MAIVCDVCQKTFKHRKHLYRHKRSAHNNDIFECMECEKKFSRKDVLQAHLKIHEKRHKTDERHKTDGALSTFPCNECDKQFLVKRYLVDHKRLQHGDVECGECGEHFSRKAALRKHLVKHLKPIKDSGAGHRRKPLLKRQHVVRQGRPQIKKFSCVHCGKSFVLKNRLQPHLQYFCPALRAATRYTSHREEPQHSTSTMTASTSAIVTDPSFDEVETAFDRRLRTFRLKQDLMSKATLQVFFTFLLQHVTKLLGSVIQLYNAVKVNVVVECEFTNINGESCKRNFKTMNHPILQTTDIEQFCCDMFDKLLREKEECEMKGSGWAFVTPTKFEIRVNKYDPLKGEGFVVLPKHMRGVVNVNNEDDFCFKYSILSKFVEGDATNPANYTPDLVSRYDWRGLDFPMRLKDINKFGRRNNISINVFGLDDRKKVFPLLICERPLDDHRDLLFLTTSNGKSHYAWVSDFNMLVKRQLTKHHGPLFVCKKCFIHFTDVANKLGLTGEERFNEHKRYCVHKQPLRLDTTAQKTIKFKNVERSQRVRFTVYADFESILENTGEEKNTHEHIPHSYSYLIKDSMEETPVIRKFRGEGAAKHFVQSLQDDAVEIADKLYEERQLIPCLTHEQQVEFDLADICHICKKQFTDEDKKVRDHMHSAPYTFRGAAHNSCNLRNQEQTRINVYFHNLKYDSHFIINELGFDKHKISVIPNSEEQYISFTKYIPYENAPRKVISLRFIDTFRFLPSSLATLAKNLPKEKFSETRKVFPEDGKFDLITRKGVFPYSHVSSFDKLNDISLPPKDAFYNTLTLKQVTDEEYRHAQNVWETFDVNTLGEYSDVYLLSDVLILADIFENFRDTCMATHTLDPAHYITLPSYSWDCMLLTTGISLDTLQDPEMHLFFENGVRGGISQCVKRLAKANNKHCKDFNPKLPSTYIQYLDANSLYSWAMSQPLPTGGLGWLNREEIEALKIESLSDTGSEGYVFEVDIHYPRRLHNSHAQYPFLCEKKIPPGGKGTKLLTDLTDKKNYIVHYRTLKQALRHGLKITKIHRVVRFDQSPWLKKYIDLNNELRKGAKNAFEKDLFKLFSNSVFGKFMENVRHRMNFKLESDEVRASRLIAKPNFLHRTIFSETMAGFHLSKTNIVLEKPIFIGMCILDISKVLMYEFFYNVIVKHYGEGNVELLYTDTDSLILEITTPDLYRSMLPILHHYDTSKYDPTNPAYSNANTGVLGKMKDETNGIIIIEFLGIKSKMYCVILQDDKYIKRCKGINKPVVDVKVHADRYRDCILQSEEWYTVNTNFRSKRHKVFTRQETKRTLDPRDDKRFLCPDGINTLPHGHFSIDYD